jgi:hypothetical protein
MAAIIVTAAASIPTASTAKTAIIDLGARLIDVQRTSANFLAIQSLNRFFGLPAVWHLNKTESAGTPRCAVCNHCDAVDISIRFKKGPKIIFRSAERKVADEKFHVSASFDSSVNF